MFVLMCNAYIHTNLTCSYISQILNLRRIRKCLIFVEVVLEFTHKLNDATFTEGEMFELSCVLSKPDVPVTWMKNRQPLTPSDRIRILCERYRHVLQIMEAIPEDEGEYTLMLPNNTETSAIIKVKGQ